MTSRSVLASALKYAQTKRPDKEVPPKIEAKAVARHDKRHPKSGQFVK